MNKRPKKKQPDNDSPPKNLKFLLSNGKWVYKTLYRIAPRDSILSVMITVLSAAIPTLSAFITASVLDEVISIATGSFTSLTDAIIGSQIPLFLGLLALTEVILNILARLESYIDIRFTVYHFTRLRQEFNQKISTLDIQHFENPKVSNVIRKAEDNIWKIRMFFQNSTRFLTKLTVTVVSGTIALHISPIITIIIVILSIPDTFLLSQFMTNLWNYINKTTEENRRWWWLSGALTHESHMPEHKTQKSNNFIYKIYNNLGIRLAQKELVIHRKRFYNSAVGMILSIVTFVLVPIHLIGKLISKTMTVGQYTFYQGRFFAFSTNLNSISASVISMIDLSSYISFVRKIYEIEPVIKSGDKQIDITRPPVLEIKNLSFKYPGSKNFVLKNVNMKIKAGQEIAIVGKNGAGKTTLIKLILRFYDPTEGEILVNGIPLKKISLECYYKLFGALFQDYNTYHSLSIKENIAIGRSDKKPDMAKIVEAAKKADAEEFIEKLEHKYDQILSKQFTSGTKLSKGQWQKVALARMFYRDTPVLILDEPTASIDAEAEYKIFKRIYKFIQDKTVIIISHRFSTVRNASTIYVLDKGKIIESGSHSKLINLKGQYAKAFNLQAKGYQHA